MKTIAESIDTCLGVDTNNDTLAKLHKLSVQPLGFIVPLPKGLHGVAHGPLALQKMSFGQLALTFEEENTGRRAPVSIGRHG